jgi:hypothetical protein
MTVAGRLEVADPTDFEEAPASTDRPDYVIYHLGELLGVPVPGEREL